MSRRFTRDLWPTFPATVQMAGTHPVVYSANGSHGLWAAPGSFFPFIKINFESRFLLRQIIKST